MYEKIISNLENKLKIKEKYINNVLKLLEEGNTIAFIARYRKELTNSMDEVAVKQIQDEYNYLTSLEDRKLEVIRLIEEKGLLTEELRAQILVQEKIQRVEDLYRPFKEKKRTKATIAKEKGLEPLANYILKLPKKSDLLEEAKKYINEEKEVTDTELAIKYALDIIAENISDNAKYREYILENTKKFGVMVTKAKKDVEEKDENKVYINYYDYTEKISTMASHRILAVNRAEKEDVIKVSIDNDKEKLHNYILKNITRNKNTEVTDLLMSCIEDSFKRLIFPSIEREIRSDLTNKAEEESVVIFSENLKQLLLQSPLKGKRVLGVDPAFRTGCKMAVVDELGTFVDKLVMYPHKPASKDKIAEASKLFLDIIKKYNINLIAIGNGTASRETESFVYNTLRDNNLKIEFCIVNEAGASVYSASDVARDEFPDFNVEERSAVSIARRIQDPLSELVKIDPKSIGVGQYQHDITPKYLEKELQFVVETAVNNVGVDVNTASESLLSYVSGVNKQIAKNIVTYRKENGKINSKKEISKVPRLGKKTFEQCVGFFRINDGNDILDATGIHPESYDIAIKILNKFDISKDEVGTDVILEKLQNADLKSLALELDCGYETLEDIIKDLKQPKRDIRDDFAKPVLKSDILTIDDLVVGDKLSGTVRNITQFGAFVDIGLKQDAMIHISKISKKFIKNPLDVLKVGQIIEVYILDVDKERGRVSLSMFND
ncbi:Tex family protein [Gemelliphila palaticanis]|uniref:RNA-binding transcriptional accessory protein n=1 Tax=Gemelliphila palaticanis TaxID=81950 RepID=A0ABX2T3C3_9BACL|nr:Tex family protein [Gemella palaticanis]MBF0716019.1 RNA-binding transcriptional accessory protein [Gemella palaticanis]NYS47949.1 RNA-binding transcriptional accessory protein [Gemella palaticanis]